MSSIVDEVVARQLQDIPPDIRFVIIHPVYTDYHRILTHFLDSQAAFYIRFEGTDLNFGQLQQQLNARLQSGLNAGDLGSLHWLLLDECDRALPDDFANFLNTTLQQLGDGRIVIFTRTVPEYLHTHTDMREQSQFIPSDPLLLLPDYARPHIGQAFLEVNALGAGRVTLNGTPVVNWDGTLPRALFFFLIDRGMTTRKQIFETFWPGLTVREATNVFHVTKRKISEVLGFDLTRYWSGFYHISPDIQLNYDVTILSQLIADSSVANSEQSAHLLSRAVFLYKSHFLTSINMLWTQKRREEVFLTYGEALTALARLMEVRDLKDESLGLYVRASVTNPQREDIARSIMSLYAEKGMIGDAEATYRRLEDELDRSLGVAPARETQELIGHIRTNPQTPV
jgi:DNA-binding SARP family transcriptional activator